MEHFPKLGQRIISIHSLVKRETAVLIVFAVVTAISIHSLVKRETHPDKSGLSERSNFNPLPRKEGDACRQMLL